MRSPKALWVLAFFAATLLVPSSHAQGNYLDVYIAKAKPEKVPAVEAMIKKMVDANRKNQGDNFIVLDTLYGEMGVYYFISPRANYGEVDKGAESFANALTKSFGEQGGAKLEADFFGSLTSAQTQIRRRRPELSRKMPADPAAYAKLIGTARVLRTTVVHIRPGHTAEFEAWLKEAKELGDKNPDAPPSLVSTLADGGSGGTYFLSSPRTSLSGFDNNPTLKDIVGEENFAKLQKILAEGTQSTETMILHYRPDLSYPPQAIADAEPAFWNPKPAASAKPKSKPAPAKPDSKP